MTPTTSTDPARWALRRPVLVVIAFALIPVLFTAAASAAAQIVDAGDATAALIIAAGAGISAAAGLAVVGVSPPTIRQYGLRAPVSGRAVLWFVPLPITIVVAIATQGVQVSTSVMLSYAVLTMLVAVNEEVWFRGIILAVLRPRGVRVAVIGSSVLFGVLHLANLAGGAEPAAAALQVLFAALFGVIAAELTVISGSLWPAIAWHAAWDFVNYLGGNAATGIALTGVGIACAVMLAYAVLLWRRAVGGRRGSLRTAGAHA